jgi:hypothetical protein
LKIFVVPYLTLVCQQQVGLPMSQAVAYMGSRVFAMACRELFLSFTRK